MRKLFFAAVLCLLALPAFATDYWQGLLIVANVSHADAEATVQGYDAAEIAHSAIVPVRVMLPYGDPDGVTYLAVYQPTTSEDNSCIASSSWASLPADAWTGTCIGGITGWAVTSFATRALAVTAYGLLDYHIKAFAIGPIRTVSATYPWVLVFPTYQSACQ